MKFPLIFSTLVLTAMGFALLGGCTSMPSTSTTSVEDIIKSCNNQDEPKTMINGHAYFCDDYAHFEQQMQGIAHQLQQRGI